MSTEKMLPAHHVTTKKNGDGSEVDESDAAAKMKNVVSCVDFSMQTDPLESDQRGMNAKRRLAKFLHSMFRSKSDNSVKSSASKAKSTTAVKPRRKFVRIARDDNAPPPELVNDNPYVDCKYSQEFLEEHYEKSSGDLTSRPLPYSTSGHTILKKSSTDPTPSFDNNSPFSSKHATFKDIVEVHEYSGQDMVSTDLHYMHEEDIHDDEEILDTSDDQAEMKGGFFLDLDNDNADNDLPDEKDDDRSAELKKLRLDLASDENVPVKEQNLNRIDGIRQNIFSAMGNPDAADGIAEAKSEPAKRVKLAELILQDSHKSHKDSATDTKPKPEVATEVETTRRVKHGSKKDVSKETAKSRREVKSEQLEDLVFDFAC